MRRINEHTDQQGFLTIAQNGSADYLSMAYVQAMSIKLTMPGSKYAVVVDNATDALLTEEHRQVFDYVIKLDEDYAKDQRWKLGNEWQVFWLTPFKETIKLEADILIPRSISHWWNTFRLRDVVLSLGCRNYKDELSNSKKYRELFVDNYLPDVYNGLMYFRYSQTAANYFSVAREIFLNWGEVAKELTKVSDEMATTDVAYALACKIIGPELTTIPTADFINFIHMKPGINDWPEGNEFHKSVNLVVDPPRIRVNNIEQYHPFHYHYKDFITSEIIEKYQNALRLA